MLSHQLAAEGSGESTHCTLSHFMAVGKFHMVPEHLSSIQSVPRQLGYQYIAFSHILKDALKFNF